MTAAPEPPAAAQPVGSAGGPEVQHVLLHDGRRLAFACLGAPLAAAKLICIYYHGENRALCTCCQGDNLLHIVLHGSACRPASLSRKALQHP